MAVNKVAWVGNLNGSKEPLVMLGIFQAGGSQVVKRGEILKLDSQWKPIGADHNGNKDVAIANEEIKSGDRAGYYEIIIPRPGDIFEFALDTAAATAVGATLKSTADTQVLSASGSNALCYAVGQEHYPLKQGHLSDDAGPDRGTAIRTIGVVRVTFKAAASYAANFLV